MGFAYLRSTRSSPPPACARAPGAIRLPHGHPDALRRRHPRAGTSLESTRRRVRPPAWTEGRHPVDARDAGVARQRHSSRIRVFMEPKLIYRAFREGCPTEFTGPARRGDRPPRGATSQWCSPGARCADHPGPPRTSPRRGDRRRGRRPPTLQAHGRGETIVDSFEKTGRAAVVRRSAQNRRSRVRIIATIQEESLVPGGANRAHHRLRHAVPAVRARGLPLRRSRRASITASGSSNMVGGEFELPGCREGVAVEGELGSRGCRGGR